MLTNKKQIEAHNQLDVVSAQLKRSRNSTFSVQPAGFHPQPISDFWLHMEFDFHIKSSDVQCVSWFITDSLGTDVSLDVLSYEQVQFLAQAMSDELELHKRLYYAELEADAYQFHPKFDRD